MPAMTNPQAVKALKKRYSRNGRAVTSATTKAIINCLRVFGHFVHRQNNMGWQRKGRWINPNGVRGVPDITGCTKDGKYLGVEIKTGKDVLSDYQISYMNEITKRGGVYLVAGSVDEIITWHNNRYEKQQAEEL